MAHPFADELETPRITPAVQWMIALNAVVFLLQLTLVSAADMQRALGFEARELPGGWWTAFTYMFVHAGFWHLALNMYTLFVFGPRVEHSWGAGGFTRYYILCGLGGFLAHFLFFHNALLVGASAAVFGVMYAYAKQWPDEEVLFFGVIPMKVKWLVAAFVVSNLVMGLLSLSATSGTAYFAHLGGVAAGFLVLRSSPAEGLARLRERIAQIPDVPDEPPRAVPKSLPRTRERSEIDDVVAKSKALASARRPAVPAPPRKAPPMTAGKHAELDLVLDKISEQGIDSLTTAERRLLEEYSKSLRGRT